MRRYTIIMSACLIAILLLSGCSIFKDKAQDEFANDELFPVSSIVLSEEAAKKLNEQLPVHLYFANADNTKLVKEIKYVPIAEAKKSTSNLASYIVKQLIEGPADTATMKSTIPEGTQLRGPVKVDGLIAVVDLTREFVDNHPGGKELEELSIYSITNSLTELKDIEKVKFMINGKTEKEFKGSFKFDAEFPRNETLIDSDSCSSSIQGILDNEQSSGLTTDSVETVELLE